MSTNQARLLPACLALTVLFLAPACRDRDEAAPVGVSGDRVTISVAFPDDVARHAALYALEQGIVTSETVDVAVSYLPPGAVVEAASAGRYDVIEAPPLLLARPDAGSPDLLLLSAGELDLDGTLLFAQAGSSPRAAGELRGRTVGIASLAAVSTLETRYLLRQKYGLAVGPEGREVAFREAPEASLPDLLREGEVDAVAPPTATSFRLLSEEQYQVISQIAQDYQELTGTPAAASVLLTYAGVAEEKGAALAELNRVLAESVAYFRVNQEQVMEAVASEQGGEPAYLRWWWQAHDLQWGSLSEDGLAQIVAVWEAARTLGDIDAYPEPASVAFNPQEGKD